MNVVLIAMAVVGDAVGYSIGYKAGPMIFTREQSLLFRKDHLVATQKFYEKHGGKTIIIARFMPAVRTFAPSWPASGGWATGASPRSTSSAASAGSSR